MLGEELLIQGGVAEHQTFLIDKLRTMGARIEEHPEGIKVWRAQQLHATDVETQPYPGFPTDMQAQLMAAASIADGSSTFSETVFENRFMHVAELGRMGANSLSGWAAGRPQAGHSGNGPDRASRGAASQRLRHGRCLQRGDGSRNFGMGQQSKF